MESSSSTTNDEPKPKRTKTTIHSSLNDFPEHLLLHILSFLPTLDAIRASSLSRQWRNLWFSMSFLNFSYDHFPPSSDSPADTRRRFANAVIRTLRRRILQRSPPLLSFRLLFDFGQIKYASRIESWIRYALKRGVLELDVDFFPNRENRNDFLTGGKEDDPVFDFPFFELENAQVRVLKLSRCYLYWDDDYVSTLKFDSIRSVSLDQSYLRDSMVSDLLNVCPNLESLSLRYCWGMENAKYFGPKLKTLSLKNFNGEDGSSVEIDCPNLVFLEFHWYVVDKYTLNYSPALVQASVYFPHTSNRCGVWSQVVNSFGHVEKLAVQNWWYKVLERNDFFSASFKLYNVRLLELKTGYTKSELHGIAVLLELSPNLEMLILDYLHKLDKNVVEDENEDVGEDEDEDVDEHEHENEDEDEDEYEDEYEYEDEDADADDDEDGDGNDDESLSDELVNKPINLSLPRLRQAKLKSFAGSKKEYLFLDLLKKQGVVCQKIEVIHLQYCDGCGSIVPPEVWVRNPNGAEVQGSSPHWKLLSSY